MLGSASSHVSKKDLCYILLRRFEAVEIRDAMVKHQDFQERLLSLLISPKPDLVVVTGVACVLTLSCATPQHLDLYFKEKQLLSRVPKSTKVSEFQPWQSTSLEVNC